MDDVFSLQDRITERVVAVIEPKVRFAEIERVRHKPAANLDAYDLLLRALQLEFEFTEQSLAAALRYLRQAIAIDSSYAPALALAAYCCVERRVQGWTEDPEREAAEGLAFAIRAVDLAGDKALFQPQETLQLLDRAERLSPRDPRAWVGEWTRALAYFVLERYDEAATWAKNSLARNRRSDRALRLLAASYGHLGDRELAAAAIRQLTEVEPGLTITKVRRVWAHWPDVVWGRYSEGLRLAGLAE